MGYQILSEANEKWTKWPNFRHLFLGIWKIMKNHQCHLLLGNLRWRKKLTLKKKTKRFWISFKKLKLKTISESKNFHKNKSHWKNFNTNQCSLQKMTCKRSKEILMMNWHQFHKKLEFKNKMMDILMLMRSLLWSVNNFLNCNKKINQQPNQIQNKKNKIHFSVISLKKNQNRIPCQKLLSLSIVKKSLELIPNILWF